MKLAINFALNLLRLQKRTLQKTRELTKNIKELTENNQSLFSFL